MPEPTGMDMEEAVDDDVPSLGEATRIEQIRDEHQRVFNASFRQLEGDLLLPLSTRKVIHIVIDNREGFATCEVVLGQPAITPIIDNLLEEGYGHSHGLVEEFWAHFHSYDTINQIPVLLTWKIEVDEHPDCPGFWYMRIINMLTT